MIEFVLALVLYLNPADPTTESQASLAILSSWLNGSWLSQEGKIEEHWTNAAGGLMLGMNLNATKPDRASFEYLRIEIREDGLYYVAQPQGRAGTIFKMTHLDANKVVFENPDHDFPQVITYFRKNKRQLCAAIGSLEKPNTMTWCWQRVRQTD